MALVDRPVIRAMRGANQSVRDFFETVTHFGESTWYLVSFAVLAVFFWILALKRHALAMLFAFCAIAGPGLANQLLKLLIGRVRPRVMGESLAYYQFHPFMGFDWDNQSMPSGHACNAATLTVVFCTLVPQARYFWPVPLAVIAFSRVAIDVHFPSDIVLGYTLGLLGALGIRLLFERKFKVEKLRLLG
jgi:undecaprenyl-diphosphatase